MKLDIEEEGIETDIKNDSFEKGWYNHLHVWIFKPWESVWWDKALEPWPGTPGIPETNYTSMILMPGGKFQMIVQDRSQLAV